MKKKTQKATRARNSNGGSRCVQRVIRSLLASGKRMVIAIDSKGVHFRETLCVAHDGDSGESRYDTKPIGSMKYPRKFRDSIALMLKTPNGKDQAVRGTPQS